LKKLFSIPKKWIVSIGLYIVTQLHLN